MGLERGDKKGREYGYVGTEAEVGDCEGGCWEVGERGGYEGG